MNTNKTIKNIEAKIFKSLINNYSKKYNLNNITLLYKKYEQIKRKYEVSEEQLEDNIIRTKKLNKSKRNYLKLELLALKHIIENKNIDTENEYNYPDYNNNNFIEDITNKCEFHINLSKKEKTCDSKDFELSSYQIFLKNFISEETPYNSILIYHGTGTGKTCSAISIAENYKDIYHNKGKEIIILCSKSIIEGWKNNIYNPTKEINQCTGSTYIKLMDKTKINQNININNQRNKLIKRYYNFYGYLKFANMVKKIIQQYSKNETGEKAIALKIKAIKEYFSNRLLIIDEVHNIRSEDDETSKDIINYINIVVKYSDNLKLIMLSATPMYNKASEIIWLLNLMLKNDNRESINEKDIFKEEKLTKAGKTILEQKIRGYISYIRGETPEKYPIRIYPDQNNDKHIINYPKYNVFNKEIKDYNLKFLKLYGCKMKENGTQENIYTSSINSINESKKDPKLKLSDYTELRQILNISYKTNKLDIKENYGKKGLKNIFHISNNKYTYIDPNNEIFDINNIEEYSSKIYNLLKIIENSEGIIFIYSQYIYSGIIPLILALEQNGYVHAFGNNILNKKKQSQNKGKYISITANKDISKNNDEEIRKLLSEDNLRGEKIKIILGNVVASEGLIREIHVLDPWYHLNRLEQIIGRGIRYCSHEELEPYERNVTIYLYVSTLKDNNKETSDIEIYRKGEEKGVNIGKVELLLKEGAIDCKLFKYLNIIKKEDVKKIEILTSQKVKVYIEPYDRPYTKICSYQKNCDYNCKINKKTKQRDLKGRKEKLNMNTLNTRLLKNMYSISERYIKELFKIKNSYTIDEITEEIKKYIDIDIRIIYLTLEYMIQSNSNIININDIEGKIIYSNNNYLFQPYNLNDKSISYYDRTIIKEKVMKHIDIKTTKDQIIDNKEKKIIKIEEIINKLENIIKKQILFGNIEKNLLYLYNWIVDNSIEANNLRYEFAIERLTFNEKKVLLINALENNIEISNIVLNHFKYNIIYENYKINIEGKPIGFFLYYMNKPKYIVKEGDNYIDANSIIIKKIEKEIIEYKRTEKYNKIFKNTSKYFTYNFKNKKEETKLKIVNYETNDKKLEGFVCQSGTGESDKKFYIKHIRENHNEYYFPELENRGRMYSKPKICDLLELIFRRLNKIELQIYHYNYDSIFLKLE